MLNNIKENYGKATASPENPFRHDIVATEICDSACNEQSLTPPTNYEWGVIKSQGKDGDIPVTVQLPPVVPAVNTPEYHPNLKDKRVTKRLEKAIGGITGLFNKGACKHSGRLIDKVLGSQRNPLSKWLRKVTLITTDDFYSKKAKKCKEHELNKEGIQYLVKLLNGTVNIPWGKYQKERQELKQINIDAKLAGINEDNESEAIKRLSNELALEYCEIEFGESLRNGTLAYTEKSNRYWNLLQKMQRSVRDTFFAKNGYRYDYDIECCSVTLIMQYAKVCQYEDQKTNPGKKIPVLEYGAISEYMHNKEFLRKHIADEAGVSIDQVKTVLNALVNGASVRNPRAYLYKKLGPNVSRTLGRNQFIKRFVRDIKSCWDCINSYDDKRTVGLVFMKNGVVYLRKEKLSSRQKASIYFKLEQKVIDAASTYILGHGIGMFKIHDGWVTNKKVDEEGLIKHIKYTTGFDVKIKFKLLSC